MDGNNIVDRRTLLKGAGFAAAALTAGGCSQMSQAKKTGIHFGNAYFYDADGNFKPEAAKDAYIALMKYHGYPVFADAREKLWISDYGAGQFTKLGLGAIMFVNN